MIFKNERILYSLLADKSGPISLTSWIKKWRTIIICLPSLILCASGTMKNDDFTISYLYDTQGQIDCHNLDYLVDLSSDELYKNVPRIFWDTFRSKEVFESIISLTKNILKLKSIYDKVVTTDTMQKRCVDSMDDDGMSPAHIWVKSENPRYAVWDDLVEQYLHYIIEDKVVQVANVDNLKLKNFFAWYYAIALSNENYLSLCHFMFKKGIESIQAKRNELASKNSKTIQKYKVIMLKIIDDNYNALKNFADLKFPKITTDGNSVPVYEIFNLISIEINAFGTARDFIDTRSISVGEFDARIEYYNKKIRILEKFCQNLGVAVRSNQLN